MAQAPPSAFTQSILQKWPKDWQPLPRDTTVWRYPFGDKSRAT